METLDNNYENVQNNKAPLTTKEMQSILLNLLIEFDNFCNDNNLKYCLGWGSELGAVLYKGFIPWDDDIDICMPRKDYNIFLKKYIDHSNYKLLKPRKTKKYYYPFAKLSDTNTYSESSVLREDYGLFLDIVPFDMIRNSSKLKGNTVMKIRLLGIKALKYQPKFHIKKRKDYGKKAFIILRQLKSILYYIYSFINWKTAYRLSLFRLNATRLFNKGHDCYCHIIWSPDAIRRKIDYFDNRIRVPFENTFSYINVNYDEELRECYGDYTIIPKEEDRKTHSYYKYYRKEKSNKHE